MRQSDIRIGAVEQDSSRWTRLFLHYVAVDGDLAGLVAYADKIRPESRAVIHRLHAIGIRNSIMLTGDNAIVARSVGRRLGLSRQFAEMLPSDKAEVIREFQRNGNIVAMVGRPTRQH